MESLQGIARWSDDTKDAVIEWGVFDWSFVERMIDG